MINSYLYNTDGSISQGDEAQISVWENQKDSIIWLDIQYTDSDIADLTTKLLTLGCHDLALTDAFRKRHPPKVEVFDNNIFVLYKGIHAVENNLKYKHQQIAFFISDRLLVTLHPQTSLGINLVLKEQLAKANFFSPISIALEIIHQSAGIYLEKTLSFEDELSGLEDELRTATSESALVQLANYKSELIKLKRIFNYHHVMFAQIQRLCREEESPIDLLTHTHKVNDVAERLERLHSLSHMHYEICGDMIDSYISITSHKLNNTMRILTVVTAIFVPLTFLAGIYGMNFENIPELKFQYAYHALLLVMTTMAIGLVALFKKKQWF